MKIIVINNIKGGTGKSTITANLISSLIDIGHKVCSIDLDSPQHTLFNYVNNRSEDLPLMECETMDYKGDCNEIKNKIDSLREKYDFVFVDTPGGDFESLKDICMMADIIVTPISDSYLDLDVVLQIKNKQSFMPGCYSKIIWDIKKKKSQDSKNLDWVIVPNKFNVRKTKNQESVYKLLSKASPVLSGRISNFIKDRVVFKELFNKGRTVFDLKKSELTVSRVAAKNEIRMLSKYVLGEI
ncbi:division plane positioning ATPase MipZ [Candidatus Nesciobacter abundans]|uniref:AAA family ATPase n=1 Tax=Candidatus Nesciobacter abundans TaxID=2601668 RepID=A0A5C0UK79_9PROT|nr:division plane positioning ATPase MipZ [Candidatus Nesciobacter abundans]QEK39264.1 AAA family ATPase [Candidatus Nesciobacter abundans]